jgi:hypothetical protein
VRSDAAAGSPTRLLVGNLSRSGRGKTEGLDVVTHRPCDWEKLERAGRLVVSAAVALAQLIDAIRQIR